MSRVNEPSMGGQGQQSTTEQMRQKASEMSQTVRERGAHVKEAAQEQIGHLRDSATEYYEQGRERAMQWEQDFEDYVREQPMKSVLIAAGVGLLLGFLWRRS